MKWLKKWFTKRNLRKAIKLINKHEDVVLQFIPRKEYRVLIDTLTDILAKL